MTLEQRLQNIRDDQEHGAAFLAREALRTRRAGVESGPAESREQLREHFLAAALRLTGVRPSMPAICHLVVRATEMLRDHYKSDLPVQRLQARLIEGLEGLIDASRKAHEETVQYAADLLLKDAANVLTFSWSSNVQDTLVRAAARLQHVYVAEARPLCEGRELARVLGEAGISTTLITDAAMGWALERVGLCLVGADGVLQDGSLINKTGSYLLALAAKGSKIPFYSICETFKYHVGAVPYEAERKAPEEVSEPLPGVEVSNVYFESVPPDLIQGYITELGVVTPHLAVEQIHRWQRQLSEKKLFGKWD